MTESSCLTVLGRALWMAFELVVNRFAQSVNPETLAGCRLFPFIDAKLAEPGTIPRAPDLPPRN